MALSTAVFVGDSKEWIPELIDRAKNLKVNAGKNQELFLVLERRTGVMFLCGVFIVSSLCTSYHSFYTLQQAQSADFTPDIYS